MNTKHGEDPYLLPNQTTDTLHFAVSSGIPNENEGKRLEESLETLPKEIVFDAIVILQENECLIVTRRRKFPVPIAKAAAYKAGFELAYINNPLCRH